MYELAFFKFFGVEIFVGRDTFNGANPASWYAPEPDGFSLHFRSVIIVVSKNAGTS